MADSRSKLGNAPHLAKGGSSISSLLSQLARVSDRGLGGEWKSWLHAGGMVGRFELMRELGRGGFGIVWEARDTELRRNVAFKAVRADDPTSLRDQVLLREAEVAARLSHPNIVALYDVGRSEHGPYLILELLRGQTLAQRLERGPVSIQEARRIALDVAEALAHAHGQGVVHRDLKPGNVFLCDDGQVKVLDFGMAHAFGCKRIRGGTPAYMAPEQARGAPEDERTDVFALGVMLFRMLFGVLPFEDEESLCDAGPAPCVELPGASRLADVVARMLEKDPVKRPREGADLLAALANAVDTVTIEGADRARRPVVENAGGTFFEQATRRRTRAVLGVAVAGVALLAVIPTIRWRLATRTQSGGERIRRDAAAPLSTIAVLPFVDTSETKDQEYFANGLADELLTLLANVPGLQVAGRTSSFSFKGTSEDVRSIGQKLNVGSVLEGSVRKSGNEIRITVQLIDTANGYHLWSQSYDRNLTDVLVVQEEIAWAVVEALKLKLGLEHLPASKERRTGSIAAYDEYLLGRQYFNMNSVDGYKRAQRAYEKAVAIDPTFVRGWAGLAASTAWVAESAESVAAIREGKRKAMEIAEKAILIGPDVADGYVARGFLRVRGPWDWVGARADLQRALMLRPASPEVLTVYAWVTLATGHVPAAVATLQKAAVIDPLNPHVWGTLGIALLYGGEAGPAREALARSLGISPNQSYLPCKLGVSFLLDRDPSAALAASQRSSEEYFRIVGSALAHHDLGNRREAQEALDTLIARFGHGAAYQIAEVYAWRGETDRAFEWLERARAQLDSALAEVRVDPLLRNLRGDPRYVALLNEMKFPTN